MGSSFLCLMDLLVQPFMAVGREVGERKNRKSQFRAVWPSAGLYVGGAEAGKERCGKDLGWKAQKGP